MVNVLLIVGAYLLGSVPFGLVLARCMCRTDPREAGSRNTGATNVARTCGTHIGVLTLVLDILKGVAPVALALSVSEGTVLPQLVALAAVAGHIFSVFMNFRGGKAVATTVGVFIPLAFWPLLGAALTCLVVIMASGYVSLGSLTLVTALTVLLAVTGHMKLLPLAVVIMLLVFWRHRENIQRLARGEEKPWRRSKAQAQTQDKSEETASEDESEDESPSDK